MILKRPILFALVLIPTLLISYFVYLYFCNYEFKNSLLHYKENVTNLIYGRTSSEKILSDINNYRINNGLSELKSDPYLCEYALYRATNLFETNTFSHKIFDSDTPEMHKKTSYGSLGENLARGFVLAEDITPAWIKSPPHKAILDKPYSNGCVATYGNIVVLIAGGK